MDIVAHRGYANTYPENTLEAFEMAANTADWIEFDVRQCGSGEIVVFHDENLSRATNIDKKVCCTSWDTLKDLQIFDSDERIPLLREAVELIPDDVGIQIELKHVGIVPDVLEMLHDQDNPTLLISFSLLALKEVREYTEDVPYGYILHDDVYHVWMSLGIDVAEYLDCDAVHMYYSYGSNPELVDYAHDHGLFVQTATPTEGISDQVFQQCQNAGVDRVSMNEPYQI